VTRKKRPSDQRPSALVREREARWGALPSKPRSYSMTCCKFGLVGNRPSAALAD